MFWSTRLFFLPVLGALLLGACQQPSTSDVDQTDEGVLRLGSVAVVDTVERAVAPNDRPLVIDGFRGRVNLSGSESSTADLRFARQGRGQDRESAKGVLEDVEITESGSDQSFTYTLETDGGAYAVVDVIGTVPRASELRIEQSKGPVSISGVQGALTVDHDHGPVTIEGAAASVDVQIENGDIQADFRTLPPEATVTLQTANGDVRLGLPSTASAQVDVQTNVGVIRTSGLSLSDERFMPRNAGGQYTAQMGAGEASIEVQVQNGSILLQGTDAREEAVPVRVDTAETESLPADSVAGAPDPSSDEPADGSPDTTIAPQPEETAPSDTTQTPSSPSSDTATGR